MSGGPSSALLLALLATLVTLGSGCGGVPAAGTVPRPGEVAAGGAFSADLRGELRLGPGDDAALTAEGTFGQDSVALTFTAADGLITGGNGDRGFDQPAPPALGPPPRHGIAFEVWVQGQHTADAVLWLDAVGRPVTREQTVRFPGGEMRVRESYEPGSWLPGEGR